MGDSFISRKSSILIKKYKKQSSGSEERNLRYATRQGRAKGTLAREKQDSEES